MVDTRITQGITLPADLLENTKQEPLSVVLPYFKGFKHWPLDLIHKTPGVKVFTLLEDCFKKSKQVSEGMLANVIWGFEQCGWEPRMVAAGIAELKTKGYIFYSDENRVPINETDFDPKKPIWIRYTPKFVELLIHDQ